MRFRIKGDNESSQTIKSCIKTALSNYFKTLLKINSWVATSHLRPPMAFISHNSSDTPGLAPLMNVLFWGRCDFPISFSGREMSRKFEIISKEVLWSVRGSYQTVWGPPLPNVTRHSGWWPHTVTSSIDRTLHQFWPLLIWNLLLNLTVYLIVQGFHRTYATGATFQQRTLTPPDTWSCLFRDLHLFYFLRPATPYIY